jgi:hypothetical protein
MANRTRKFNGAHKRALQIAPILKRIHKMSHTDICFFKIRSKIALQSLGLPISLFPAGLPVKYFENISSTFSCFGYSVQPTSMSKQFSHCEPFPIPFLGFKKSS